jgi:CubicO group peptidase (beta-lactamase class C family)
MANLDYDVPITPDSVFYIASTSKQFVAACIVLLAQKGDISLDDDIRMYVPEMPQHDAPITIRHLVHHTSGLRDYLALMELAGRSFEDYFSTADAIAILARQKAPNNLPGERFLYCNSGYALMGEVVRRVSGRSLREFAGEKIFRPLGMAHTHFDDDRKMVVKDRVVSYGRRAGDGYQHYLKNFDAVGSGGLLTTVSDLCLWDRNFYHHKVGDSDFVDQMLVRGRLNDGTLLDYAFGLEHGEYRGLKTMRHAGSMLGFRTQILRFPEQRFTVICLANLDTIDPTRLAQRVTDIFLGGVLTEETAAVPTFIELPDDALYGFVGLYQNSDWGSFAELRVQDGQLTASVFGQDFSLEPVSANVFRSLGAPIDVEVRFEHQEEIKPLLMQVVVEGEAPVIFQAVKADLSTPDRLAVYAGKYYSDELDVSYELAVVGGELYCRYRNAPTDPLQPGPRDVFWHARVTLEFVRDFDENVSGFTLNAEGARYLRFIKGDLGLTG